MDLHARLDANEEAGWEHVATGSRTEYRLRDRLRFLGLCVENAILRALAGGSLSWN